MSNYYTLKKVELPTKSQIEEKRALLHAEHLDYFYGDFWSIYIEKDGGCYLEFDEGHLATKFITREISKEDYESLKSDKTLFKIISRKVR